MEVANRRLTLLQSMPSGPPCSRRWLMQRLLMRSRCGLPSLTKLVHVSLTAPRRVRSERNARLPCAHQVAVWCVMFVALQLTLRSLRQAKQIVLTTSSVATNLASRCLAPPWRCTRPSLPQGPGVCRTCWRASPVLLEHCA